MMFIPVQISIICFFFVQNYRKTYDYPIYITMCLYIFAVGFTINHNLKYL